MSLKVYFPTGNPKGIKVLIVAELAGVKVEHVDITYESLKSEEHLKRYIDNLNFKTPTWKDTCFRD